MLKTITPRRSFNMDDLPKNDGMTQIKNNETRYVATNTFFHATGFNVDQNGGNVQW